MVYNFFKKFNTAVILFLLIGTMTTVYAVNVLEPIKNNLVVINLCTWGVLEGVANPQKIGACFESKKCQQRFYPAPSPCQNLCSNFDNKTHCEKVTLTEYNSNAQSGTQSGSVINPP